MKGVCLIYAVALSQTNTGHQLFSCTVDAVTPELGTAGSSTKNVIHLILLG